MTDGNEIDVEVFGEVIIDHTGDDQPSPYPAGAEPLGPVEDVVVETGRPMEQLGFDGTTVTIADDPKLADKLRGLILASNSGGDGHIVTIVEIPDGNGGLAKVVSCTCPAIRNLHRRPLGCWGMQIARKLAGIPDPI